MARLKAINKNGRCRPTANEPRVLHRPPLPFFVGRPFISRCHYNCSPRATFVPRRKQTRRNLVTWPPRHRRHAVLRSSPSPTTHVTNGVTRQSREEQRSSTCDQRGTLRLFLRRRRGEGAICSGSGLCSPDSCSSETVFSRQGSQTAIASITVSLAATSRGFQFIRIDVLAQDSRECCLLKAHYELNVGRGSKAEALRTTFEAFSLDEPKRLPFHRLRLEASDSQWTWTILSSILKMQWPINRIDFLLKGTANFDEAIVIELLNSSRADALRIFSSRPVRLSRNFFLHPIIQDLNELHFNSSHADINDEALDGLAATSLGLGQIGNVTIDGLREWLEPVFEAKLPWRLLWLQPAFNVDLRNLVAREGAVRMKMIPTGKHAWILWTRKPLPQKFHLHLEEHVDGQVFMGLFSDSVFPYWAQAHATE